MNKIIIIFFGLLLSVVLSCEKTPTYEPVNDSDALISIVTEDYPTLFKTQLINTDIPDTSYVPNLSDYEVLHYWRDITGSNRDYDIYAVYPDSGELMFAEATVVVTDTIKINFNIIARDTTAEPDTMIRITKPAIELMTVKGKMIQYGDRYDPRNGWILQDVSYTKNINAFEGLESITLSSIGIDSIEYSAGDFTELRGLKDILEVGSGEEITIITKLKTNNGKVSYHIGKDEFVIVYPEYIGDNKYRATIIPPQTSGYFHITIDVFNDSAMIVDSTYSFARWSVPIHIAN